jgi:hypothetical protein
MQNQIQGEVNESFIPERHVETWKLVAEIALIVIVAVSFFEIAHYVFHVKFSEGLLLALELIDYFAIFILGIDLLHHFSKAKSKPEFMKNKFFYILSFLPYLIFTKAMGAFYLLKPLFTGAAKIIKLGFHLPEIKKRAGDIKEKADDLTEGINKKKK